MATLKLIEIQENNWMISRKNNIVGFVFKTKEAVNVLSREEYVGKYSDFDDFCNQHKVKVTFEKMESKNQIQQEVNGYPTKHNSAFNIETDPVVSYTKLEHSQDRYAAGYYGIKFKETYQPSFCPRVSTITSYEYVGPFKTILEMNHAMKVS